MGVWVHELCCTASQKKSVTMEREYSSDLFSVSGRAGKPNKLKKAERRRRHRGRATKTERARGWRSNSCKEELHWIKKLQKTLPSTAFLGSCCPLRWQATSHWFGPLTLPVAVCYSFRASVQGVPRSCSVRGGEPSSSPAGSRSTLDPHIPFRAHSPTQAPVP